MVIVHISHVKQLTYREINRITDSLSHEALTRINKKRNEAQRLASLCALSLIPQGMGADLDYSENGKPFFKTLDANISISHSEKYVVIALTTSRSEFVGIDVEDNEKFSNGHSMLRFFTENERASAQNGTPEIEIWTKKEALFKYLKSNDISFIFLDSTTAKQSFTTIAVDGSHITLCTEQNAEIEFIYI